MTRPIPGLRKVLLAASGLSVLALLAGCSVVKPPARPEIFVYTLEPAAAEAAPPAAARTTPPVDAPIVVVALPESGPGYGTRRMAYSHGGGQMEYFATHRWADSPARMLASHLRDALSRTGAFRAVATEPTRALADLRVESEVRTFRQEVDGAAASFRAVVRVTVLDPSAPQATRSRLFEIVEPLDAPGPERGVRAANRAVARLLREAAEFVAAGA